MDSSKKLDGQRLQKIIKMLEQQGVHTTPEALKTELLDMERTLKAFNNKRRAYEEHIAKGCPREVALRAMVATD